MLGIDISPILLRFLFGGSAVVASRVVAWSFRGKLGGILAAFSAVMAAAVIMAGHFGNSKQASDTALGASAGMLGCAAWCSRPLFVWST